MYCCGDGCNECKGVGKQAITEPPNISEEIWETLSYCDLMDKGHPPISGGTLEQDRWFLLAYRFVTSEWRKLEAEAIRR